MTPHQITGEPASPWVVPIEPQPERNFGDHLQIASRPPKWTWKGIGVDSDALLLRLLQTESPYQPGDVLEFFPVCYHCDKPAVCTGIGVVIIDNAPVVQANYNLCQPHCEWVGRKVCADIKTARRTVVRVAAEHRDGMYVWVVETEDAP